MELEIGIKHAFYLTMSRFGLMIEVAEYTVWDPYMNGGMGGQYTVKKYI